MELQTISPLSAQNRGKNPKGVIEEIFTFVGVGSSTERGSEAASWNSQRRRQQHLDVATTSGNAARRREVVPPAPDDLGNTRMSESDT